MNGILIDILEDMIMVYRSKLKITLDEGSYKTEYEKRFDDGPDVVEFFNTVLEAYASMGYVNSVTINVFGTEINYSKDSHISIKETRHE